MASLRDQIDEIKSKIKFSDELSKYVNVVSKGSDLWCLCLFHNEKTPSMKINDDLSSYYCFGCGAKGDILSFYTDYLKYSFDDAIKELAKKTNVVLNYNKNKQIDETNNKILKIIDITMIWYHQNIFLEENKKVLDYLKERNLSIETIKKFNIGFTSKKNETLTDHLKKHNFENQDLLKTNLFKMNKENKLREFFYNRIMFPIINQYSQVVGFGGRSIDNSNPKYINSAESSFFKKGKILYNLNNAKDIARKKGNLLICEGYMDVISLSNNNINGVVAPLGTAMTYDQLMVAWKFSKSPTLMFDGDVAGQKASIKTALLALRYLKPNYSLKIIELNDNEDPDSFINKFSIDEIKKLLLSSKDLSNYIFDSAKKTFTYQTPDQKIVFDKYFDDITNLIEDKKVRFHYKNEFKQKLYNFFIQNKSNKLSNHKNIKSNIENLANKEILSFIACYINHVSIRSDIIEDISKINFDNLDLKKFYFNISQVKFLTMSKSEIINNIKETDLIKILKMCLNSEIYKLFPYSSPNYDPKEAAIDVKKSLKIIERRLSNSLELDKSLKDFKSDSSSLKWEEFKNLSYEFISEIEN